MPSLFGFGPSRIMAHLRRHTMLFHKVNRSVFLEWFLLEVFSLRPIPLAHFPDTSPKKHLHLAASGYINPFCAEVVEMVDTLS